MVRRLIAVISGVLFAVAAPAAAWAAEEGGTTFEAAERAMDPSADWSTIVLVTLLAVGGLFLLATIGYMYRRERNLDWEFQKPDAPRNDHH